MRQETASQIVRIARRLGAQASFRRILLEANKQGVVTDHRTLRRYLDLLTHAEVLKVRERNVHSVNPQQLYTVASPQAHLWAGLTALEYHGLNWDTQEEQLYRITADPEAVVRSKPYTKRGETRLIAGREDSLVQELRRDAEDKTGTTELVAAMIATKTVDLAYLVRRADKLNMGQAVRLLLSKTIEAFTSLPGDVEGGSFLTTRDHFLKILRNYNSRGLLKILETQGIGRYGLETVRHLTQDQIVAAAAKQLGMSG